MIHFKPPNFPARYRIDGIDLYDIHELNRHGQMLQELALSDAPNREWVGLTAKDLAEIPPSCYEGAIWAEAKLREKNHENIEKVVLR